MQCMYTTESHIECWEAGFSRRLSVAGIPRWGTFASLGVVYVPFEKRTNLDPTTEKGIFVTYSETLKAFCIYIPALRKTTVRRGGEGTEVTRVILCRGWE